MRVPYLHTPTQAPTLVPKRGTQPHAPTPVPHADEDVNMAAHTSAATASCSRPRNTEGGQGGDVETPRTSRRARVSCSASRSSGCRAARYRARVPWGARACGGRAQREAALQEDRRAGAQGGGAEARGRHAGRRRAKSQG